MRENFMSGIDEGRQDKRCEACLLLYSEKQIGDFAFYGVDGKHYAFKNIMTNFGINMKRRQRHLHA